MNHLKENALINKVRAEHYEIIFYCTNAILCNKYFKFMLKHQQLFWEQEEELENGCRFCLMNK